MPSASIERGFAAASGRYIYCIQIYACTHAEAHAEAQAEGQTDRHALASMEYIRLLISSRDENLRPLPHSDPTALLVANRPLPWHA
jgi:hypothetical protein